ncbi:MAG: flagellar hook-associated protein FlgL [Tepidisphaeraceae bacterium]
MAILPISLARVSNQLRANVALSAMEDTQAQLTNIQNQLSTGRQLNEPSDNPGDASVAMQLRRTLEKGNAYAANLSSAQSNLGNVDSTLGDISDLLNQAQSLASANVGDDVTQDARNGAAIQVDSIYNQMLDLGNKSFNGSYLFAGDKLDQAPFQEFAGGVQFVGSAQTLSNDVADGSQSSFQVNGAQVFGALSTQIDGTKTLTPAISTNTRLADLGGATNQGIRKGSIAIGNGTTTVNVDLTNADTVGDVINAINNAGIGSITAAVNASGTGISLSGGAGESISVADIAGGTAAADLGIKTTAPLPAGTPVNGLSANAGVTPLTPLAALNGGAGIDLSGLKITNGTKSATIDLSSATTVQDLLNAVNGSGTGVQMQIKPDGTGFQLLNTTQGTNMSVSENGGTTAADLGLRSFTADSKLADLNGGQGVRSVDGPDFSIKDSGGHSFDVDITSSMTSVQDVINAINTSATTAGASVTASFSSTQNGIVLTDTAGGAGTLTLTPKNTSNAAADLGLTTPASGNVITGTDVNPVKAQGIFADLNDLRNAMRSGDKVAMTNAAQQLQGDYTRVVNAHGAVGAQVQALQSRQTQLDQQTTSNKALLSQLEDVDFTQAATKFQLLQTSLQAAMQTTSTMLNLSLMDFLK